MNYTDYLHSKDWAYIRDQKLRESGGRCELCTSEKKINVHHNRYPSDLMDTTTGDLVVICEGCHVNLHYDLGRGSLATGLTIKEMRQAVSRGRKRWNARAVVRNKDAWKARRLMQVGAQSQVHKSDRPERANHAHETSEKWRGTPKTVVIKGRKFRQSESVGISGR